MLTSQGNHYKNVKNYSSMWMFIEFLRIKSLIVELNCIWVKHKLLIVFAVSRDLETEFFIDTDVSFL